MSHRTRPLEGIRIIDLSMGWAGPLATRNLADMGAQVIKVESCERFDWWRSWEATQAWIADNGAEKSPQYLYVNRNKQDITLDLENPRGRELLLQLVATADALVENYSGGVLPKLKLDYSYLIEANPDLVMVSMPAFGSTGPWSQFRAYGSTVEHSSGLPHLVGDPEQAPTMQHVAFGDAVGGLNGTAAILTALWHRQRTGEGQFVDLSQVECLFPLAAPGILHQSVHGQSPQRFGNAHPDHAPHGVYPCEGDDAWVVIQITDETQWHQLQDVVPSLTAFGDLNDRLAKREAIDACIGTWTQQHTATEVMQTLQAAGVTAAKLNNGQELLHEPHLHDRGYLQWLERDYVGVQPHPSAPFRTAAEPIPITSPAPTLGQHNHTILRELLGLSADELQKLEQQGIIGTKPRMPQREKSTQ
jgi:crotonobetainyl-CoA:carnitine CoA-transferase CaiB-like acyl-CoA transferase